MIFEFLFHVKFTLTLNVLQWTLSPNVIDLIIYRYNLNLDKGKCIGSSFRLPYEYTFIGKELNDKN